MPGRQPVNEQVIYTVFYNLLNALLNTGVGVCGGPTVKPLAGRTETMGLKARKSETRNCATKASS